MSAEDTRLEEDRTRQRNWKRWGPWLSERQWGTVREDYSATGEAWDHFTHDQARSRAYRWGEDGLLGICDRECRLCLSLALWNGRDAILKERLFGLTGSEGNHGEDVKEEYVYRDATPTASWAVATYRYPLAAYPYEALVGENARRGLHEAEYELIDTGVLDDEAFVDATLVLAKADADDCCLIYRLHNHSSRMASIHALPTVWFRNTWSWNCRHEGCGMPGMIRADGERLRTRHQSLEDFHIHIAAGPDGEQPQLLWTDNHSNAARLFGHDDGVGYHKDAIHRRVVEGELGACRDAAHGSKVAAWYRLDLAPGGTVDLRLRLRRCDLPALEDPLGADFTRVHEQRRQEADGFYDERLGCVDASARRIARMAHAGLVWSRQFYHLVMDDWLDGDDGQPPPPPGRDRNAGWRHLYARDVLSMPDAWEYPWFAAWDLAFHMVPQARTDAGFAKHQLDLMLREWYLHPNGQLPAYEWAFDDVNPPVHAWACLRVYRIDGGRDHDFLRAVFHKLLLNFTWWVNRKDPQGNNLFAGGFLGLDNIGPFDRSKPLPAGWELEQADGTAWMAFYCLSMLGIALELARVEPVYEDMASKFLEHFVSIADAINAVGGVGLWHEEDGFYYDRLVRADGSDDRPVRVRSLVGLIALCAVQVIDGDLVARLPGFNKRLQWFLTYRSDLAQHISFATVCSREDQRCANALLLAVPKRERLERLLGFLFDEDEFLSDWGVRSMSRHHREHPLEMELGGERLSVAYAPGDSPTHLFGGNSNWRGPVWFPINWLIVEALLHYDHFYGDQLLVALPGHDESQRLSVAARELARRLARPWQADAEGRLPFRGHHAERCRGRAWQDWLLFHEYFDGDTGRGLGANHQLGWTALVAECLRLSQLGDEELGRVIDPDW